nr:DUF5329 family protein [Dyella sp. ASV21]
MPRGHLVYSYRSPHVLAASLIALSWAAQSQGLSNATSQREIHALLDFVAHSHCTFIRNGKPYDAIRAENHLEDKLRYLQRLDQVHSTDEFITRAGTQSSVSGEPYLVNCDGRQQTSAAWLRAELQRIRSTPP